MNNRDCTQWKQNTVLFGVGLC